MSRHSLRAGKGLSPVLVRVIQAAKASGEDAEGRDIRGAADALQEFGALALWALPIHGLFVPNNNNVCVIVDRVAKKHLGREEARRAFQEALKVVELFEHRDPIESAHNHVQSVSDEAYFYAGLAFGVTLADS